MSETRPSLPETPDPQRDPWVGLDVTDHRSQVAFRADPHPFLRRLRREEPVNQTPLGIWRLSRHADCVRLLREVRCGMRRTDGTLPFDDESERRPRTFMLRQDPPNHTRLRKLVSKAFTPRAIERLRPRVQQCTDDLLDRVASKGEMDVIADLALPVPATMICEMMGVPVEDRDRFTAWTSATTHLLAAATSTPENIARGEDGAGKLSAYFEELIERRRSDLGDDILSNLIRAEEEGDRLSHQELMAQSVGLLIAGFETTIGLIGNGVLALLRHPEQLARLRAEPELIASCVEECLRYDGPIPLTVRVLHEDADFGGKRIPKDAMVMAMLAGANRDPDAFAEPERFDVGRDPNPHLAFGGGAHLCLGRRLALIEGEVAIGSLVRRFDGLELRLEDATRLEWGTSLFRVLGRLPIGFEPA